MPKTMQQRERICIMPSIACAEESLGKENKKRETSRGRPAPNVDQQPSSCREGQSGELGLAPTYSWPMPIASRGAMPDGQEN